MLLVRKMSVERNGICSLDVVDTQTEKEMPAPGVSWRGMSVEMLEEKVTTPGRESKPLMLASLAELLAAVGRGGG